MALSGYIAPVSHTSPSYKTKSNTNHIICIRGYDDGDGGNAAIPDHRMLARMTLKFESKHNIPATFQITPSNQDFIKILRWLQGSNLVHALTTPVVVYENHIRDFWGSEELVVANGVEKINAVVVNKAVVITEEEIRRVLQLNDAAQGELYSTNRLMHIFIDAMGYQGILYQGEFEKGMFHREYRYVCHLVLNSLSPRRGGFSRLSQELASAMVAILYRQPFNFSRLIFEGLKENVARDDKFLQYPRFLQMIIDDLLDDVPRIGERLKLGKPNVFGHIRKKTDRGRYQLPAHYTLLPWIENPVTDVLEVPLSPPPEDQEGVGDNYDDNNDDNYQGGGVGRNAALKAPPRGNEEEIEMEDHFDVPPDGSEMVQNIIENLVDNEVVRQDINLSSNDDAVMKTSQETHKEPKLSQQNFISSMPDYVVTNILNRLPIQDAVRTGILAKNWRFKWTRLNQLIFDENFFKYLLEKGGEKKYGKIISRLLLHIKGGITKFVLYTNKGVLDDEDINHWLLFLSSKGVTDITICQRDEPTLKLPPHLFSCSELKHLKLFSCCFDPPASFHGFPNLLSLQFCGVLFEGGNFGEFFNGCPVLEILRLGFTFPLDKVKVDEMAKLVNLKTLSLYLYNIEDMTITSSGRIFELVGSLPNLKELHLDFSMCNSPTDEGAGSRTPIAFSCLKTLKLKRIDLGDGIMLSRAIEMIRCFPNLQTLIIKACNQNNDPDPTPAITIRDVYYNKMGLPQLRNVVFNDLKGSENEVCLIKYILVSSPFLKKIVIHTLSSVVSDVKFLFAKKLLRLQRAYHDVDIDVY